MYIYTLALRSSPRAAISVGGLYLTSWAETNVLAGARH